MGGCTLVGILPVSGINIGLVLGVAALQAQVDKLNLDIGTLQAALAAQAELSLNIPPPVSAIAQGLITIKADFDPTKIVTASLDAQADLAVQLGLIDVALSFVGEIGAKFQAGLSTGGLSLWTYAGRSASFGEQLERQTINGYPGAVPDDNIQAIIIATEDFGSWGNFSASFNTGTTSAREVDPTSEAKLTFEGTLTGGELNTGVLELSTPLLLFIAELQGLKLNLEYQLDICLGINLPPIPSIGVDVDAGLLIDSLVNVNLGMDIGLQIDALRLQIEVLLNLVFDLQASLSAGGLAVWLYSGSAEGLGSAFKSEVAEGIPGGSGPDVGSYGVVVASKLPSAMLAFGLIFGPGGDDS